MSHNFFGFPLIIYNFFKPKRSNDGFDVSNCAIFDPFKQLGNRSSEGLNEFFFIRTRAPGLQILRQINNQLLVGISDCIVDSRYILPVRRGIPRFFLQLSFGGIEGIFSLVDFTGRKFQKNPVYRKTELPLQ